MPSTLSLVLSAAVPLLIGAALALVAWKPWRNAEARAPALWLIVPALGGGYLIAFCAVFRWPSLPPHDVTHWLALWCAVATVIGIAQSLARWPGWASWSVRVLLSGASTWLFLGPTRAYVWEPATGMLWTGVLAVAMIVLWTALDDMAGRGTAASLTPVLLIVTLGTSLVLLFSGSALHAQAFGALPAALAAFVLLSWLRPAVCLPGGAMTVPVVLLCGAWIGGYFYAETPLISAVLLFVAPIVAWIGELSFVRGRRAWLATALRAGVTLVPVAASVIIAARAYFQEDYAY